MSNENPTPFIGDYRISATVKNVEPTYRLSYPAGMEWMGNDNLSVEAKIQLSNNYYNNKIMEKFMEYQMNQSNRFYWMIPIMVSIPVIIIGLRFLF